MTAFFPANFLVIRTAKPKQQIFRFNPGKQEKIFPPKHPYYKATGEVKKLWILQKVRRERNQHKKKKG